MKYLLFIMLTTLAFIGCESDSSSTISEGEKTTPSANTSIIDSSGNLFLEDYTSQFNTEEAVSFDSHVLAMNSFSNLDFLDPETNEGFENPVLFTDINDSLISILFSKTEALSREACKYHLLVVGEGMQPTAHILTTVTPDSLVYTALSENINCRKSLNFRYITFLIETCDIELSEETSVLTKILKHEISSCDDLSSKVFYGEWARNSK